MVILITLKAIKVSNDDALFSRAIYNDADIYLLDDPLSAVDTHVGRHIFEECIMKYLRDKVRILVTHQVQYLKEASKILILKNVLVIHILIGIVDIFIAQVIVGLCENYI